MHVETRDSQVALVVKNPSGNAGDVGDTGLIPRSDKFPCRIHGQRSLVSYSPKGRKESDMTEAF